MLKSLIKITKLLAKATYTAINMKQEHNITSIRKHHWSHKLSHMIQQLSYTTPDLHTVDRPDSNQLHDDQLVDMTLPLTISWLSKWLQHTQTCQCVERIPIWGLLHSNVGNVICLSVSVLFAIVSSYKFCREAVAHVVERLSTNHVSLCKTLFHKDTSICGLDT